MGRFESKLTARRLEALEALQRLTAAAVGRGPGEAVHYSLVAARMRISTWTAYGLMRELEKLGLVTRRAAPPVPNSVGGRSRVLFLPLATPAAPSSELLTGQLRAAFERFAPIGDEATAAREFLADATADLGYQLGFWLSRLEAAGRHAGVAGRAVLESGSMPLAKLQTVGAMGLGSALARLGGSRLASSLSAAGSQFNVVLEEAARASDQTLTALVDAARNLHGGRTEGALDT
ncbi:MAG TPA: hypothetical protein VGU71_02990 [Candidatus Dormibacteraeota bacterium]|nr:hypothetical protein [Candidatus Dormibacteraeota bacterium]